MCVCSAELPTRQHTWRFAVFCVTFCLPHRIIIFRSSPLKPTTIVNRLKIYLLRKHFIGHCMCMYLCMYVRIRSNKVKSVIYITLRNVWSEPIRLTSDLHATGCTQASIPKLKTINVQEISAKQPSPLYTTVTNKFLQTHTLVVCDISPTRCNNCVFILRNGFYSTCFGRQSHPSLGIHMLYMATGKLAHLGCKFVSSKVVLSLWSCW